MSDPDQSSATKSPAAPTKRILVVEDEGLVAMMLSEQLADLGYSVVGPAVNMAEAQAWRPESGWNSAWRDLR
jgi:AmiR/NasT family two-component response regulator